ncbi:MAG TPA: class I SAM-dependent methyltransferase [Opitutus sp.]|nr:class I SAM-dependent methyltransferase [Opitutus sp.]
MNASAVSAPPRDRPVADSQPRPPRIAGATPFRCRHCGRALEHTFVDLGLSPPCQSHIEPERLACAEPFYPLHVYVCSQCYLVQLPEHIAPKDIFVEYAYFSSYSDTWLAHARAYVETMTARWRLGRESLVVELASNDGYLLQYFAERHVPVLGIEPAKNVAAVAVKKGIPTLTEFFGRDVARRLVAEGRRADLLLGNNVLAHVPDINDFVGGMKLLLQPTGVITMEFPHLLRLIAGNQFDTIYHEHYSYLSFTTVETIFAAAGLALFDVDELPTHGGSLRIYAGHAEDMTKIRSPRVAALKEREARWGVADVATYARFGERVKATKRRILQFLLAAKDAGKSVAGYGAPGKGNTLLNYCGIRTDFLDYTVDRNPYKQGKYTPGTRIPILAPDEYRRTRPDYVFILPWNLQEEIMAQNAYIREWGGQFVVPIPEPKVHAPPA